MTKDERFLIELYKLLKRTSQETVDPDRVGKALGLKEHAVKTILKGLLQANLIKRYAPDEITLTERGFSAVKELI